MQQVVRTADLPEDMQDVLMSLFGEVSLDLPAQLEVVEIDLARFPAFEVADGVIDERGEEYAMEMIGQQVPPIVVYGDHWLDGRHRVFAAMRSGQSSVAAFDLRGLLPEVVLQVICEIGMLEPDSGMPKRDSLRC